MIKKRHDFSNEKEYKKYTKTSDFLLNYSWKNKSENEIVYDMALPDYEQVYLSEALEELRKKHDFSGMTLDRIILKKLNENENEDEFDSCEVIYIERDD